MNKNIIAIAVASLGFIIGLGLLGSAIKTQNPKPKTQNPKTQNPKPKT